MIYPIKDYGIIGNLHTAALVSKGGSVDWLCLPRFDSPSIFAGLLDDEKGGRFSIAPASEGFATKQLYWPDTNVLITRFLSPGAAAEVIDFMPVPAATPPAAEVQRPLIRIARVTRGGIRLRMQCLPAFNYARDAHEIKVSGNSAIFHSPTLTLSLIANAPLQAQGPAAVAEFDLSEGEVAAFVLWGSPPEQASGPTSLVAGEAVAQMEKAIDYWRRWLSKCTYCGRWREWVHRSALALELMVYEPTGAIVAAPTTSLPEWIGGTRNWDYRCSWIRDSAFTVYGLLRVGLADEAERFMGWIESRCRDAGEDGTLQTLYGIDGRRMLAEETLGHLAGYRGSRPVRVGNAASGQLQLDIYGELMDSVYLFNKHVHPISCELWKDLCRMVNWVAENYHRPDNGIWEVRGGLQHFVYSKLMCWVALDRGIRLAMKRSFPADIAGWMKTRDNLFEEILREGWSEKRQAFVQRYGSGALDASVLMMPMVFFMAPGDPRMLKTLNAIASPPAQGGLVSDSSVKRYNLNETADGLAGQEGSFNMCGFWYVEALTRAGSHDARRLADARLLFEKMLGQANHLGLFSEEAGPTGEALGNFPQAFTHLGLISAAFNLDRALNRG